MVKRISLSLRDRYTLDRLQDKQITTHQQPSNYIGKVVLKPWGFEYLVFDNDLVAIWFLHIKQGHGTSMHSHPMKKTSMMLLAGDALFSTFTHRDQLTGLDAVIIERGVFHSTKSLSAGGINMIEIETPPSKTDLVRFGDSYGRESSGYEGLLEMRIENLEEFGYFYFESPGKSEKMTHRGDTYEITFKAWTAGETLAFPDCQAGNVLYALCQGQIVDSKNRCALEIGEAAWVDALRKFGTLTFSSKSVLLTARLL
jgi:mannose-6-phosphate isomerase-like protein (cupin superfamily)